MTRHGRGSAALASAVMVCGSPALAGTATVEFEPIATSNDTLEDIGPFENFGTEPGTFIFRAPVINNSGDVVFIAILSTDPPGVTDENNSVICIADERGVASIAREGKPAPGVEGGAFGTLIGYTTLKFPIENFLVSPILSDAGDVVFNAPLVGNSVTPDNDSGIWMARDGIISRIAREGDQAPDAAGLTYDDFEIMRAALGNAGDLIYRARFQGLQFSGMWRAAFDPIPAAQAEHLPGEIAAGTPNAYANFGPPVAVSGSAYIFQGTTDGPSGTSSGLWRDLGATTVPIALQGEPAPGTDGALFGFVQPAHSMNSSGGFVLGSQTLEIGVGDATPDNNLGVWAAFSGGPLTLIARSGEPAPGAGDALFETFTVRVINSAGELAFRGLLRTGIAGVDSTNDGGIWARFDDRLRLIVREGHPAPGGGAFSVVSLVGMNALGDIAFRGSVTSEGRGNTSGIWLYIRETDEVVPILQGGDSLNFDGADHTLTSFIFGESLSGGDDGRSRALNDSRQLAINMNFGFETYGVFRATVTPGDPGPPADLDGSGTIDSADLNIVLADFGCTGGGAVGCPGDIDGDGDTDSADLNLLLADFGA